VADQLAKEGSKKQQPKSKLSYQEVKTLITNKRLADFQHRNGGYNSQQDTLRLLSRHEQTMIFRLRTGHCRLRSHMQNSFFARMRRYGQSLEFVSQKYWCFLAFL